MDSSSLIEIADNCKIQVLKRISSTEVVRQFGEILAEVRHGGDGVIVTKAGHPVARIMPCEEETMSLREFSELWLDGREADEGFANDLEVVQRADTFVEI
jgi:prevent-host-death family protein